MRIRFNQRRGLVVIPATIAGPAGVSLIRLAIDTGATKTLIASDLLLSVGYDPTRATSHVRAGTASGVELLPVLTIGRIEALGRKRRDFSVLSHTLPPGLKVDGLLGLDFLRRHRLTINFRNGSVNLI